MNEWGFSQGIARERSESRYPNLWEDIQMILIPGAGVNFVDLSGNDTPFTQQSGTFQRIVTPGRYHKAIGLPRGSGAVNATGYNISRVPYSGGGWSVVQFCQMFDTTAGVYHNIIAESGIRGLWINQGRLELWNASVAVVGGTFAPIDTWILWAVTVKYPDQVQFYFNGRPDSSLQTLASATVYSFNGTQGDNPSGSPFQGRTEWLGFWGRPLSPTEMLSLQSGAHPLVRRRRVYGRSTGPTLTTNLVAYWKLDEAIDPRADSTGLGSILTEWFGTAASAAGKIGNGVSVTTSTGYLRCVSNTNLQMGDVEFTIACWVNFNNLSSSQTLVSKDNSTNYEYDIYYNFTGGTLRFYVDRPGTFGEAVVPIALTAGTWYFVVAVHDAVNDQVKISINNAAFNTAAFAGGPGITTGNFNIGAENNGTLRASAIIDEVGIWKRVLSASEITTLYNGGAGLTYPFSAVDYTARNRRASVIGIDGLYRMVLPVPDGTIDAADRWQITGKRRMAAAPPAALIFRNRTASRMRFPTLAC
jgi:Concanavalin A-like lectin/glucanases superfamily